MKQKRISDEFESNNSSYPPSKKQRYDQGPLGNTRGQKRRTESTPESSSNNKYKDGNITRIFLQNFMTHQEFDWIPCARVNLITGVNGAGKSSILQAIVIGLGMLNLCIY